MTPRVLFVDDDAAVLHALRRTLRREYDVLVATGGPEALDMLAEAEPVAAVVSDMRMPGMDGAELLSRVREIAPDAARLLLTGYADIDAAMAAVNRGGIFRFLPKPCPPEALQRALTDAVELNRLARAERELLEQTLRGSVNALLQVLALANPTSFARASRVKTLVVDLAKALDAWTWELEVTAMLAHIGVVSLPAPLVAKLDRGAKPDKAENEMLGRLPKLAADIIAEVPRLGDIAETLGWSPTPGEDETPPLALRLLQVATEYDAMRSRGLSPKIAVGALTEIRDLDQQVVQLLAEQQTGARVLRQVREVALLDLRPGMFMAEDISTNNGQLLVGRGTEIGHGMLAKLRNFDERGVLPDSFIVEV